MRTTRSEALARLATLLADETRAAFCLALFDGRAWTAGELARHAGVARSTASEHLDRLVAGGLLAERRQGRHRYVELADAGVAELLEDLMGRLGPSQERRHTFRAVATAEALARARTCYDHLAGRLGVAVTDAMTRKGLLDRTGGVALTDAGADWLAALGADVAELRRRKRPLVRMCVDWTERRPHLAGGAGAAICSRFREEGWVRRVGDGRALLVTPTGQAALRDLLELESGDCLPAEQAQREPRQ
jgi:DNA-binding transcriptional ArsR family regulator